MKKRNLVISILLLSSFLFLFLKSRGIKGATELEFRCPEEDNYDGIGELQEKDIYYGGKLESRVVGSNKWSPHKACTQNQYCNIYNFGSGWTINSNNKLNSNTGIYSTTVFPVSSSKRQLTYTAEITINSDDAYDNRGLIFRYQDEDNYWRLVFEDNKAKFRGKIDGSWENASSSNIVDANLNIGTTYEIKIELNEDNFLGEWWEKGNKDTTLNSIEAEDSRLSSAKKFGLSNQGNTDFDNIQISSGPIVIYSNDFKNEDLEFDCYLAKECDPTHYPGNYPEEPLSPNNSTSATTTFPVTLDWCDVPEYSTYTVSMWEERRASPTSTFFSQVEYATTTVSKYCFGDLGTTATTTGLYRWSVRGMKDYNWNNNWFFRVSGERESVAPPKVLEVPSADEPNGCKYNNRTTCKSEVPVTLEWSYSSTPSCFFYNPPPTCQDEEEALWEDRQAAYDNAKSFYVAVYSKDDYDRNYPDQGLVWEGVTTSTSVNDVRVQPNSEYVWKVSSCLEENGTACGDNCCDTMDSFECGDFSSSNCEDVCECQYPYSDCTSYVDSFQTNNTITYDKVQLKTPAYNETLFQDNFEKENPTSSWQVVLGNKLDWGIKEINDNKKLNHDNSTSSIIKSSSSLPERNYIYTAELQVNPGGASTHGFLFRYNDKNNFWGLIFENNQAKFKGKIDRDWQTLSSAPGNLVANQIYNIKIKLDEASLRAKWWKANQSELGWLISTSEDKLLEKRQIGLINSGDANFDNIQISSYKPPVANINDKLMWIPDPTVVSYRCDIDEVGGNSSHTTSTTSNNLPLESIWDILKADTEYSWTVQPCKKDASDCQLAQQSEEWRFKTPNINLQLVYPNPATTTHSRVTFRWKPASRAVKAPSYKYEINHPPGTITPAPPAIVSTPTTTIATTTKTSVTFEYPEEAISQTYGWTVQPCNDSDGTNCEAGVSSYFSVADFNPPTNLYPGNNDNFFTYEDYLTWDPSFLAKNYQVYLGYTATAANETREECATQAGQAILNNVTTTSTMLPITYTMDCLGEYDWQVTACFNEDCSGAKKSSTLTSFTYKRLKQENIGILPCNKRADDPNTPWKETEMCQIKHIPILFYNILDFILWKASLVILFALLIFSAITAYATAGLPAQTIALKTVWKAAGQGYFLVFFSWTLLSVFLKLAGLSESWLMLPF